MTILEQIAAAISTRNEQDALDEFWRRAYGADGPTDALRLFGLVKIRRPASWNRLTVRAEGIPSGLRRPDACFACRSEEYRVYWHHVIWIQHGGSSHPRNFVAICHACHRRVHPWLKEGNTLEQKSGLYDAKDLIGPVFAMLQARWDENRKSA